MYAICHYKRISYELKEQSNYAHAHMRSHSRQEVRSISYQNQPP